MKNFIQNGEVYNHVAAADISSGDVVVMGTVVGVAVTDIASDETGSVQAYGVFELPKVASALAQGAKVYWTGTNVTATASGNTEMGVAFAAAASGDATVQVKLAG